MLGPLNKAIYDWLKNSVCTDVYDYANIDSNWRADSFLTCFGDTGIKRSRYVHQVTLASLKTLANEVFKSPTGYTNFKAWKVNLEKKSTTSKHWVMDIEREKLLFIFLRSLRESKFDLFIRSFKEMLPWLVALDHINYQKWGSIFFNDRKSLPDSIKEAFDLGHFTVKKPVVFFLPFYQTYE